MGKTLLTGATGFVGSRLAWALAERGDELRLTLRAGDRTSALDGLDCERARADLLDRRAVRRAMKGVDRVFHTAGMVSLRPEDEALLLRENVETTRMVLEEALRAGVERVVHTSSAVALGHADPGETTDEAQVFNAGGLGIRFVNAKHEAEVEALRLAARGLPLVLVNPSLVLGPGDVGGSGTALVKRFLLGRVPAYTDGAVNVADIDDVARAHLLADERGRIGERYMIGNRNFTFERLFDDLGRLSGVEPPNVKLPAAMAVALAGAWESGPGDPPATVDEAKFCTRWWSYRNNKAKRELGFSPSPHEETLETTVNWFLEREGAAIERARSQSHSRRHRLLETAVDGLQGAAGAGAALRRWMTP